MGLRPSDVGDYVIYCFDEAVASFGSFLEGKLGEVEGKTAGEVKMRQNSVLNKYLGPEGGSKGQFSDPALLFGK